MLLPVLALAAPPNEADTRRALQGAEQENAAQQAARKKAADQAAHSAAEAFRLTQERVEAAESLRQAEETTQDVASRIDAMAEHMRSAERRVQEHVKALQPLLPVIERLSLYPEETLLAVPAPPDTALRAVLVLQNLSRQIEQETEAIKHDQADAEEAAAALQAEAPKLADAEAAQKQRAEELDQAIAQAHDEQKAAEAAEQEAAAKAAAAASRAETLRAALAAIDAQRRADEAKAKAEEAKAKQHDEPDAAEAARQRVLVAARPTGAGTIEAGATGHGQLQPPVIGVVVRGWGERTDAGPATGLSYHAPPRARVISPCAGRVVFNEPFRSYGLLLIIDCGGGYHIVLSGFERLTVNLGQRIVTGEPVGVMPDWEPGSAAGRPALYIELRHDGTPINPAPWLRSIN